MEEVDKMILEPFDLHSTEQLDNSPSHYLSTTFKFYLQPEPMEQNVEEKIEADFDVLWTKAVDNMFKSSRLFNGDPKEEEKENVDDNVQENGSEKKIDLSFEIPEEPTLKEEETFQALEFSSLKQNDSSTVEKARLATSMDKLGGDQIVPNIRQKPWKLQGKRKLVDLDVDFSGLPAMKPDEKSQLKKLKLDPVTGKEVIEEEDTPGEDSPPKNSIFVEYNFDANARLPSFREAFVPALKKITHREAELRRKLKQNNLVGVHCHENLKNQLTSGELPVEDHSKSESVYQPPKVESGVSIGPVNDHPVDLLSEISELEWAETMDDSKANLSSQGTNEILKIAHVTNFDSNTSNNEIKLKIKQENVDIVSCNQNSDAVEVTETPSKILDISSANLKDIEKNIFSFDEGLEMFDLERDFAFNKFNVNHEDGVGSLPTDGECDWSIGLSNIPDVQTTSGQFLIGQTVSEVGSFIGHRDIVDMSRQEQYLSNGDMLNAPTLGHAISTHGNVTSNSVPLICSQTGGIMSLAQYEPPAQINIDMAKQRHLDTNIINIKQNFDINIANQEKQRAVAMHINQPGLPQFHQQDLKILKQTEPGLRGSSVMEGQSIAQQIHQSFGAGVFGAPGDDGAKILAKYLAHRGSTRTDNTEQRGGVSSAIASLIGKSFSQQEATHRLERENVPVDFLSSSDLHHLDLMNEHF